MELYPALLVAKALNSFDSRRITQTLHVRIRNEHVPGKRSEIYPFVQQVVSDLRKGLLEPHHYAYVHLFGIYKDCKRWDEGHELWQWLIQQDDRHVSQAAYGAAIELMAYGGLMSLPDLEDLYADGLKRFPGTFAEYHLSPDAIVPDRAQLTTIAGIPTILLQGILTARILARDWKKAYLALDTALRIYPTQTPPRYFELFMTERPMTEAYAAFMVACRAGIPLRPTHVTTLITKLRAAIGASQSMADRIMLLRAIANAIYGHLEAGGRIESIHVGSFLRAFEQILPEPPVGKDYEGEAAEMRDALVVAAHEIVAGLIQAGMAPQIQPFDALISVSGKLRVPNLLTTTLQDVKTAGLELGPIGIRTVITSAGFLQDKDLIEQYWSRIVANAEENSGLIPFEDWITFTKACRRADHVDYFRTQLLKLPHTFTASTERILIQQIDSMEIVPTDHESYEKLGLKELTSELSQLRSQVKNMEAVVMSGQPLDLHTTPFHIHMDPKYPSLASEKDLRSVYDELTTDPHQPPPPPQEDGSPQPAALSPTGIRVDDLRFRNWVTIHEMMDSAETYESDLKMAINAAIKSGEPLKGAPEILRLRKEDTIPYSPSELRTRIRALRASSPDDVMGFRKVASEGPGEVYKKTARARLRKHIAKNSGETIVKTDEAAPRLVYYVGLKSDNDSPNGAKRRGPTVRKVKLSDGTTAEETVVQPEDGSEEGVRNKGDEFPA
ncbi:pentatricopeptide repeat-containing protein chloroplastic q9ls25 [Stemphylium lycopersici]|uniref:Pentatricopeptide repeat-containing protein chloroplastic q9ls25 n=1 Tax=Stemphylium lycopersici TaxID=183478 RepID=A0A364N6V0_STELY|nr:pentatricopeptide repeat-containing protein chloroplastic q9ls25 [Stemphylium lycopersici]RAR03043.1 pentatricopeptide repeat-containing protein chloroplastic q9ls25 [Stemphylium lycopersici]RAR13055.1 pentatricopeptide repeat-containing protein chloroplastic q9ls25 [Stemphylium lycopersici]